MAYSRPPAKTAGDVFDLTAYDAIRDSLIASAPDNFTTKGDLFVATAADTGSRLAAGDNDSTLVADSSTSTGLAWQIQPAVGLRHSTSQDPTPSSWHTLTWDTEDLDTDGMHSTVTNASRITVPSGGAGVYMVIATVEFDTLSLSAGTSGQYGVRIQKGGTTVLTTFFDEAEGKSAHEISYQVTALPGMAVAEYLEVQVYTDQDIDVTDACRLQAIWQRRT